MNFKSRQLKKDLSAFGGKRETRWASMLPRWATVDSNTRSVHPRRARQALRGNTGPGRIVGCGKSAARYYALASTLLV